MSEALLLAQEIIQRVCICDDGSCPACEAEIIYIKAIRAAHLRGLMEAREIVEKQLDYAEVCFEHGDSMALPRRLIHEKIDSRIQQLQSDKEAQG